MHFQPDCSNHPLDILRSFFLPALHAQAESDIIPDCQPGEQGRFLEDHSDLRSGAGDPATIDRELSCCRLYEACYHAENS